MKNYTAVEYDALAKGAIGYIIETDLEVRIPKDYVNSVSERLSLYREMDNIKNKDDKTYSCNVNFDSRQCECALVYGQNTRRVMKSFANFIARNMKVI